MPERIGVTGTKRNNKPPVTPVTVDISIQYHQDGRRTHRRPEPWPTVTATMECLVSHKSRQATIDCARWTGPPLNLNRQAIIELAQLITHQVSEKLGYSVKLMRTDLIDMFGIKASH